VGRYYTVRTVGVQLSLFFVPMADYLGYFGEVNRTACHVLGAWVVKVEAGDHAQ